MQLKRAIRLALAGVPLALVMQPGAHAATMYNTYNAHTSALATDAGGNGTDGWTYGGVGNPTLPTASPGWVGTAGAGVSTTLPFGYSGQAPVNWAAQYSGSGSLTISQADAAASYGVYADIDTAGGAWKDAGSVPQGWKHNTDIGLFKSDVTTQVSVNVNAINGPVNNFGITVFTGMDTTPTSAGAYSHHGPWNNALAGKPETTSNPWYAAGVGTGMTYLTHDNTVDATNALTFTAQAGQVYTIALGGSGGINWNQQHDGYALTINAAPVPLPSAVWLLGSALLGLVARQRRCMPTV